MAVLAFDVGGTHLRGAVVQQGAIVRRRDVATPRDGAELVGTLVELAAALADSVTGGVAGAGLAVAGVLDARRGVVCASPNLHIDEDLPLVAPLQARLDVPVSLVNDVNAAALGEARAAGVADLAALFIGTGVGTGYVSGGRLVAGHRGMGGEGGHAVFRPGGRACPLGCRGCYESYLGGAALARQAREAGLGERTADVLAAWREGDPRAGSIVEAAQQALVGLVGTTLAFFDPEWIVLGGGVVEAWPELLETARQAVADHPFVAGRSPSSVEPARLGSDAGLLGAAHLAAEGRASG